MILWQLLFLWLVIQQKLCFLIANSRILCSSGKGKYVMSLPFNHTRSIKVIKLRVCVPIPLSDTVELYCALLTSFCITQLTVCLWIKAACTCSTKAQLTFSADFHVKLSKFLFHNVDVQILNQDSKGAKLFYFYIFVCLCTLCKPGVSAADKD